MVGGGGVALADFLGKVRWQDFEFFYGLRNIFKGILFFNCWFFSPECTAL